MNRRASAVLLLSTVLVCAAAAQQRNIRISSFPIVAIADGRSQVAITAEVRESSGVFVPDGTRISFATTLGQFRETIVTTTNGFARAILVSGNIAGIAKIRANDVSGLSTPAVLDFEFVSDKTQLSSAQEFVEVTTDDNLEYAYTPHILWASSSKQGVHIRYRDTTIEANDLQLDTQTLEIRAKKVRIKIKNVTRDFEELFYSLKSRKGFGITTFTGYPFPPTLLPAGPFLLAGVEPLPEEEGTGYRLARKRNFYSFLNLNRNQVERPTKAVDTNLLLFKNFDKEQMTLTAKRATVFPGRYIQFAKAEFRLYGERVLFPLPLYQLSLNSGQNQLFGESIITLNNSTLGVNYPYYVGLQPGETSLVRFRTGQSYGRGINVNRGVFFDYELNWNKGDDMQGGLVWTGLGRDDYGIGFRQFNRLNPRTNLSFQLDAPAGRSLFGAASLSQQALGFNWTANASGNKSLVGIRNSSQSTNFIAETEPIKTGKLPLRLYYGVRVDSSQSSFETLVADPNDPNNTLSSNITQNQQSYGLIVRGVTQSLKVDNKSSVQLGFILNQLNGSNVIQPITFSGQAIMQSNLAKGLSNTLTFDYVRDPLSEGALGRYRLTTQASYFEGNVRASVFANRSLDIDRFSLFSDISYLLNKKIRLGYQYTLDRQVGGSLVDYNVVLGFRIEGSEIGLVYSARTQRIGFQLGGAAF